MTIYNFPGRCWELWPPLPGDERLRHYDTKAEAKAALKETREADDFTDPATAPRQLEDRCWVIRCDGECELHIDEEDECYISHCESRQAAEETVAAWSWKVAGDLVFCEADAPADGKLPPPTPRELEAAGQMRLPGVA